MTIFRSNCLFEAIRLYRSFSRHDTLGSETWFCIRKSRQRWVPFHVGVAKHDPFTDKLDLIHFSPVTKKGFWFEPLFFRGKYRKGDFPATKTPD